jgi:hypothetical protein
VCGKPAHRPRITDYQYVMAWVQSGGLAVYGRFLYCPLFRAICGAWSSAALRRPQGGFHALHLGHPTALAPSFAPPGAGHAGDSDVGFVGLVKHAPGSGLVRRQGGQDARSPLRLFRFAHVFEQTWASKRTGRNSIPQIRQGSRLRRHFSVSPNVLSEILTLAWTFNGRLSATAAATFANSRRHFCENPPLLDAFDLGATVVRLV